MSLVRIGPQSKPPQAPQGVVAAEGQVDHYVVVDGYKRIAALEKLGEETRKGFFGIRP